MIKKICIVVSCITIALFTTFSVPQFKQETVVDTYALGCDISKPKTCINEVITYIVALIGIQGVNTMSDVQKFATDVSAYVQQGGADLITKWGIAIDQLGQMVINNEGLMNAYNDVKSFFGSKSIPWNEGRLNYAEGVPIEFFSAALNFTQGQVTMDVFSSMLSYSNKLQVYHVSMPDAKDNSRNDFLVRGSLDVQFNGRKETTLYFNSGSARKAMQIFGYNDAFLYSATFDFEWKALPSDTYIGDRTYKAGTIVLYTNFNETAGSHANGVYKDVYKYQGMYAMKPITKEYYDSLPMAQTNLGVLPLPQSPIDWINDLSQGVDGFVMSGFSLMQKNYKDFLEQIPLIKAGQFIETIPIPTPMPTSIPFPTMMPYPTSIPFPTAPPLDWAESVPLPDVSLPTLSDGELTNAGAGALTGASLGWFGNAINSLISNIGNMIGAVVNFLKAILNAIISLPGQIANAFVKLFEWLGSLIMAIPDLIVKGFSALFDFLKNFWENLLALLSWLFNPADIRVKPLFDDLGKNKFLYFNDLKNLFSGLNGAGEPFEYSIMWNGQKCVIITTKWFVGHPAMIRSGITIFFSFGLILAIYQLLTAMFGLHQSKGKGDD